MSDWGSVVKGGSAVVVRGKKVPKGSKGKVFWLGSVKNPYNYNRPEYRAGLELEGGERVFLPAYYLERVLSPEEVAAKEAEAAAVAKAKAEAAALVASAGIDFSKKVLLKHSMLDWSDRYEYKVAFAPEASDAAIKAAIERPGESGWGKLRYSGGVSISKIDREANEVYYGESVMLCD